MRINNDIIVRFAPDTNGSRYAQERPYTLSTGCLKISKVGATQTLRLDREGVLKLLDSINQALAEDK